MENWACNIIMLKIHGKHDISNSNYLIVFASTWQHQQQLEMYVASVTNLASYGLRTRRQTMAYAFTAVRLMIVNFFQ